MSAMFELCHLRCEYAELHAPYELLLVHRVQNAILISQKHRIKQINKTFCPPFFCVLPLVLPFSSATSRLGSTRGSRSHSRPSSLKQKKTS